MIRVNSSRKTAAKRQATVRYRKSAASSKKSVFSGRRAASRTQKSTKAKKSGSWWGQVKSSVRSAVGSVARGAKKVVNTVTNGFKSAARAIGGTGKSKNRAKAATARVYNTPAQTQKKKKSFGSYVSGFFDSAKNAIKDVGSKIVSKAKSGAKMVGKMVSGIGAKISEVKDEVFSFGKSINPYNKTVRNTGRLTDSIKVNGKIDRSFSQGKTGDCWLLASIHAISNNEDGLKMLNNNLSVDKNGNVRVYLPGPKKYVTVTQEELRRNDNLSSGDGDVRAYEIAVKKYMSTEYPNGKGFSFNSTTFSGNNANYGFWLLTGKGRSYSKGLGQLYDKYLKDRDSVIDEAKKGGSIIAVSTDTIPTVKAVDTNGHKVRLHDHHAYSLVDADNKYVYLVNPWDTSETLKVTHSGFKKTFNHFDQLA